MERVLNPRLEKETIYEIYRSCRLCGDGAGYKMPIVQNVVNLGENGVNLSKKILECLQIEVHQDDKMPPLICELCVDKVNDFYDFLELSRQTNKRTRLKLGLPLQSLKQGKASASNDCILGVTEPIYIDDDSDVEPLSKHANKPKLRERHKEKRKDNQKDKDKHKNKDDDPKIEETLKCRREIKICIKNIKQESPPPVRVTRNSISKEKERHTPTLQETVNKLRSAVKQPKSILKTDAEKDVIKIEDTTSFLSELKRTRGSDDKSAVSAKKVRLSTEAAKMSPKPSTNKLSQKPKSKAASSSISRQERAPTPDQYMCPICYQVHRTPIGYNNHMRAHVVNYTNNKLVCNPCGEWFLNSEETTAHHKRHKYKGVPYTCRKCHQDYANIELYNNHLVNQCVHDDIVPDARCEVCWREYPTENLLMQHKCLGVSGRPGGKCEYCNRTYVLLKNLKWHQKICKEKRKSGLIVGPGVMERLMPLQIRLVRCDALLDDSQRQCCDVSTLDGDYGIDKNCVYPYISSVRSLRVKTEPIDETMDCKGSLQEEIKEEICDDFNDWESDDAIDGVEKDSDVGKVKKVDTLAKLALKAMCSQRCLGKVPKKYSKIKVEKMFDSLGEFGVKNVDKLLEKLDDVDVSDGKAGDKVSDSIGDVFVEKSGMLSERSDYTSISAREDINNVKNNGDNASENSNNNHLNEESHNVVENKTEDLNLDVNTNNEELNGSKINGEIESNIDSGCKINKKNNEPSDTCASSENIFDTNAKLKDNCNNLKENIVNEGNIDSAISDDLTVELNKNLDKRNTDVLENSYNKDNETLDKSLNHETVEYNGVLKENSAANNVINTDKENNAFMDAVNEETGAEVKKASSNKMFDGSELFDLNIGNGKVGLNPRDICDSEDKVTLDDLFENRDKSMGPESVSDEDFNFDV